MQKGRNWLKFMTNIIRKLRFMLNCKLWWKMFLNCENKNLIKLEGRLTGSDCEGHRDISKTLDLDNRDFRTRSRLVPVSRREIFLDLQILSITDQGCVTKFSRGTQTWKFQIFKQTKLAKLIKNHHRPYLSQPLKILKKLEEFFLLFFVKNNFFLIFIFYNRFKIN